MSRLNCPFARYLLDSVLSGKLDFLDGVIGYNSCDHVRRMFDNWRLRHPPAFYHFLSIPHRTDELALNWFKKEIINILQELNISEDGPVAQAWLKLPGRDNEYGYGLLNVTNAVRGAAGLSIWNYTISQITTTTTTNDFTSQITTSESTNFIFLEIVVFALLILKRRKKG